MMDIPEYLDKEKKTSLRIARNFLSRKREEMNDLGLPMRVMMKELTTYNLRGGKWHRPTLTRLTIKLLGKKLTPEIARASIAVELMHRYILVHDDIIDLDLTRHGGPTLQKVYQDRFKYKFAGKDEIYSLAMAMIGGDVINSLTHLLITECGLKETTALAMIKGINQDFIETGAGWCLETDLKNLPLLKSSMKQVMRAMQLVSAHYSVLWPLRLGQILAGRKYGEWIEEIEIYGQNTGLAFQIQDDVLAIFGDQRQTGKPVGNDLREGKKTLLIQYAWEYGDNKTKRLLEQTLGSEISFDKLMKIRQILTETGALEFANIQAEKFTQTAITALTKLDQADEPSKNLLIDLAKYLSQRQR